MQIVRLSYFSIFLHWPIYPSTSRTLTFDLMKRYKTSSNNQQRFLSSAFYVFLWSSAGTTQVLSFL